MLSDVQWILTDDRFFVTFDDVTKIDLKENTFYSTHNPNDSRVEHFFCSRHTYDVYQNIRHGVNNFEQYEVSYDKANLFFDLYKLLNMEYYDDPVVGEKK